MTADFLALQNVGLRLGRSPRSQLQNISFELQPGETVALVGPRGSGKTSLLKLLNGLLSPSQGQILWQGHPLAAQPAIELRRQIAWLPQQPRLLGMTGKEAITYPLQLQGLKNRDIQQRLDVWLDILKIPLPWLEKRSEVLPQAAIQAIAMVRALALEPQLLLLDNPWPLDNLGPQALNQSQAPSSPPAQSPPEALVLNGVKNPRSPLGDFAPKETWDNPQVHIQLALSQFTQRGGSLIWAMTPEAIPSDSRKSFQRLLHLVAGELIGDDLATQAAWSQAKAEQGSNSLSTKPAHSNDAYSNTAEPEDWD